MDDFDARRASLDLVTAFVNNNQLSAAELPTLLSDVFLAISGFGRPTDGLAKPEYVLNETATPSEPASAWETKPAPAAAASAGPAKIESPSLKNAAKILAANIPAVSIEASLADPQVIVSLITGEKFKMLRRHLKKYGLTEAEYKSRFNLPGDYPMVARAYAALRRDVATAMHAKKKKAGAAGKPGEALAPAISGEVPKPAKVKTKATPKKTGTAKKAAELDAGAVKVSAARPARAKSAKADFAPRKAARPAEAPTDTTAPWVEPELKSTAPADAEPVKVVETPKNVSTKKPGAKRRMARQPAIETKSMGVANSEGIPALVEQIKAADVRPAVSPKQAARKLRKSASATATSEDGAKAKPSHKGRKTLSPAYR